MSSEHLDEVVLATAERIKRRRQLDSLNREDRRAIYAAEYQAWLATQEHCNCGGLSDRDLSGSHLCARCFAEPHVYALEPATRPPHTTTFFPDED